MKCNVCGAEIPVGAGICPDCGNLCSFADLSGQPQNGQFQSGQNNVVGKSNVKGRGNYKKAVTVIAVAAALIIIIIVGKLIGTGTQEKKAKKMTAELVNDTADCFLDAMKGEMNTGFFKKYYPKEWIDEYHPDKDLEYAFAEVYDENDKDLNAFKELDIKLKPLVEIEDWEKLTKEEIKEYQDKLDSQFDKKLKIKYAYSTELKVKYRLDIDKKNLKKVLSEHYADFELQESDLSKIDDEISEFQKTIEKEEVTMNCIAFSINGKTGLYDKNDFPGQPEVLIGEGIFGNIF